MINVIKCYKIYDKIKRNRNMIVENIKRKEGKGNFVILIKKMIFMLICQKSSIGFEIFISLIICNI